MRRADREQRQAADLVQRLDAVEELEEAGHDVDRDAGIPAGADRLQQLLVAGAREGDDHAVDLLRLDDLVEVVEPAQPGQVGCADVVHLVVDHADRNEAELAIVSQLLDQLPGDDAGAEDQGALAQLGGAMEPGPHDRPGDAGQRSRRGHGEEGERDAVVEAEQRRGGEEGPGDQHHGDENPRNLRDRRGPGRELIAAVEADAERDQRPGQAVDEDVDEAGGEIGGETQREEHDRGGDESREHVAGDQPPRQHFAPPAGSAARIPGALLGCFERSVGAGLGDGGALHGVISTQAGAIGRIGRLRLGSSPQR